MCWPGEPPETEDEAQNPPLTKNGAAAAANDSKRARKRKHLTKKEKAKKKKQMTIWAQGMKLHDVVLTREEEDVETFGLMKWPNFPAEVCKIFMMANNIKLSESIKKPSKCVCGGGMPLITFRCRT